MSQDKREAAAKKIVREETEPPRHGQTPGQKPEKPEQGGFRDLFEDMWSSFEDPQDSKKMKRGKALPTGVNPGGPSRSPVPSSGPFDWENFLRLR